MPLWRRGVVAVVAWACVCAAWTSQRVCAAEGAVSADALLQRGYELHVAGALSDARSLYQQAQALAPANADVVHLLGLTYYSDGDPRTALPLLQQAVALDPTNANMYNSLGEVQRTLRLADAAEATYLTGLSLAPDNVSLLSNLGRLLLEAGDWEAALTLFEGVLARAGDGDAEAVFNVARAHHAGEQHEPAAARLRQLLDSHVAEDNPRLLAEAHLMLGTTYFHLGMLPEAIATLEVVPSLDDSVGGDSLVNLGACYHLQGKFDQALEIYGRALELFPGEARILNNMGAIYTIQHRDADALRVLNAALESDPDCYDAMTNLATYYQERGGADDLARAKALFARAYELTGRGGILLRSIMGMPSILPSVEAVEAARAQFEAGLDQLLAANNITLTGVPKDVERLPFGLVYHGRNDRRLQEKFAAVVFRATPSLMQFAPHLTAAGGVVAPGDDAALAAGTRKIRIGLLSKFFTMNHAHGQLLRGVMAGLNRAHFTVVVVTIANPQEYLNPEVLDEADEVYHLPLIQAEGQRLLKRAALDILVFADQMSEPHSWSYSFGRFATVQAIFWGNPTTPGHIDAGDYFVSGDRLEVDGGQAHYTEQLMRLSGQGIWYDPIHVPPASLLGNRKQFGLEEHWVVYACPQSTFKMHPEYDSVLADVLRAVPDARLLMVEGRRTAWTQQLKDRFAAAMPDVYDRILFYKRLPNSDHFMTFLSVVDVLLHPFPFGGSKTAADGIALGVPVVTWPQQFLRGRMAHSFYHSMAFTELVATSAADYVAKAVRLGTDAAYRQQVSHVTRRLGQVIWQRAEVVAEWQLFFLTSVGYHAPVRRAARERLEAIQAADLATLQALHREVQAELPHLPPPVDRRALPAAGQAAASAAATAAATTPVQGEPLPAGLAAAVSQADALHSAYRPTDSAALLTDALTAAELDGVSPAHQALLHVRLAFALFALWRLDDAGAHFSHAARLAPEYPEAHNGVGVVAMARGDVAAAVPAFQTALQLQPAHWDALFNLGRALQEQGRVLDVAALYAHHMQLPQLRAGLERVVCAALSAEVPVPAGGDSPGVQQRVLTALGNELVEQRWMDAGTLLAVTGGLSDGDALFKQVSRLRGAPFPAVNGLSVMLGKTTLNYMMGCSSQLRLLSQVAARDAAVSQALAARRAAATDVATDATAGVHVVVQYFVADTATRQAEVDHCLRANLDNPAVEAVHVLVETEAVSAAALAAAAGDAFPYRLAKLQRVVIGTRLTYEIAFAYAGEFAPGRVVALVNADVYFDHTLQQLTRVAAAAEVLPAPPSSLPPVVMATLRWEQTPWGSLQWVPRADSQDAWLFRAPLAVPDTERWAAAGVAAVVHASATSTSPFAIQLGAPRCDFRIAGVLADAGVVVRNPSLFVHAIHVHADPHRNYTEADTVGGAGRMVPVDVVW